MRWENWSGSVVCDPQVIEAPSTQDEIIEIVKRATEAGKNIRVVGSGHSFTPLVQTNEILMTLDNYQGLLHVDKEAAQVTIKAGTKIKRLSEILFEHGLAQENLGDIDVQSIAGAISTGTHGTGANLGTIATQVIGIKLITASGDVVECSHTHNVEIFKAAQISLGALGIISEVTLQCVPAYRLHYVWKKLDLEDVFANLEQYKSENRNFEFFWIPYTSATMCKFLNITEEPAKPKNRFRQFNEVVIENGVLWLFCQTARMFPSASSRIAKIMSGLISGGSDVQYSHQIFATTRAVKFQEMEYNIPVEHFEDCLREIDATIREKNIDVMFPIECRFIKGDDIPLSPATERDSAYIAVHMNKGMPHEAYFSAIEAIFVKYNGRPHWGKIHTRVASDFETLYPQWEQFQKVRQTLDPSDTFLNSYLRKTLIH